MLPTLFLACILGAEPMAADPTRAYTATATNAVTYDVDFRVIVTAPQGTKKLRVWVPVPQDDVGQKVESSAFEAFPGTEKPAFHTEPVFGNRFAYFEFDSPQGAQILTHRFRITVSELRWNVDTAKVQKVAEWPKAFDPYRRGEQLIKVDEQFTKLANEIASGKTGPAAEISAVMDWVQKSMTYDHSNTSLVASSDHALAKLRGDCSDYHGLCSSLGRALGVPTRVTYGLHAFPKNLPSHCKLETYLHPYGWVSFDVSETQRLVKLIESATELTKQAKEELKSAAVARMRAGFRDNTWFLITKGTDYELAPKASTKVPLVGTIYAEADGKPLPTPDPADTTKREFAWMTSHKYTASQPVSYPFRDWKSLSTGR
jgi:transglutaminase-like putative cysteine protease